MARSQVCSTSTNCVTSPSMWPPRGLNLPSCLKVKSYLCHPSKSCIYTTSYLGAIHIATKKHNIITYFGLLSFSIVNRLKAILLSIDASYVNYLTVPLQRYSLHSLLLSHWEGLLVLVLLCCLDWLWYKKLPVLRPSMTLRWFKILHSFKGMTPHECFVVWLLQMLK